MMKGFFKPGFILGILLVLGLTVGGVVWKKRHDQAQIAQTAAAADLGKDAYRAARLLVGRSLLSSPTATFGEPGSGASAGYLPQSDGTWKVWGWVDTDNALGGRLHEEWRAVMQHQGDGRKWRALWLKIGDQQSGEETAWKKED